MLFYIIRWEIKYTERNNRFINSGINSNFILIQNNSNEYNSINGNDQIYTSYFGNERFIQSLYKPANGQNIETSSIQDITTGSTKTYFNILLTPIAWSPKQHFSTMYN